MLFYTLLFIAYIIPVEAGNIIFSSPTPGTKISAGSSVVVSWDITVDSGDLTLESASGNSVSTKLLTSGLDGKSFTWTPTESDLSSFAGSGTVLRLLDRKDNARSGVSGTLNVDSPQKALAPTSPVVVQPTVPVISTSPSPRPTPIVINTIVTTNLLSTQTPTSDPPRTSTRDSIPTSTTSNDPTTLISSTLSESPTSATSTNFKISITESPSSTPSSSNPSSTPQGETIVVTAAGYSPQPTTTSTSTSPPTTPTLTTPIKTAIAVTSTFTFLFVLIVVFYFGKRTARTKDSLSDPETQNNIQTFLRRAISGPSVLKPELDSESAEILELAAMKEREFFEIEGRGLGTRKSVAELQGVWEGVELEDTSRREWGGKSVGT